MQYENFKPTTYAQDGTIEIHKVLRNTYFLLSLTLIFSACTAAFALFTNAAYPGVIVSLAGMFGLLFLTQALRNSVWGLVSIFAFTGFMGYVLGPTLNAFLHAYANGGQIILTALGATGVIFLGLSADTVITKKDFSYLGGLLFVGLLIAIMASLAAIFFQIAMLQLVISAVMVLIASGLILFDTSRIIQNGERNYIMATISLYLDIYILFTNLLNILGATSGRN